MSSILQALKKLDDTSPAPGKETSDRKQEMKRLIHRRAKGPWLIRRLLPLLVILTGLTALGWWLTDSGTVPVDPVKQEVKREVNTPPKKKAAGVPSKKWTEPLGLKAKGFQPPVRNTTGRVENKPERIVTPPKKTRDTPEAFRGLSLEGIVWNDDAGKRQALINGRGVKEGDTIKGVAIIEITKEWVRLKAGEKKWRLWLW